jgi:hypothetical protein
MNATVGRQARTSYERIMMRIEAASSADADTLAGLNQYVQSLHMDKAPHVSKPATREAESNDTLERRGR